MVVLVWQNMQWVTYQVQIVQDLHKTTWEQELGYCQDMACVFLVNLDHGIPVVKKPILDADSVDFYGTTMLWCPSLNPVVERCSTKP